MSPTETGAQRAALIKKIEEMGGPRAYSGEYIGKATKFWCDATEFLWGRMREAHAALTDPRPDPNCISGGRKAIRLLDVTGTCGFSGLLPGDKVELVIEEGSDSLPEGGK